MKRTDWTLVGLGIVNTLLFLMVMGLLVLLVNAGAEDSSARWMEDEMTIISQDFPCQVADSLRFWVAQLDLSYDIARTAYLKATVDLIDARCLAGEQGEENAAHLKHCQEVFARALEAYVREIVEK